MWYKTIINGKVFVFCEISWGLMWFSKHCLRTLPQVLWYEEYNKKNNNNNNIVWLSSTAHYTFLKVLIKWYVNYTFRVETECFLNGYCKWRLQGHSGPVLKVPTVSHWWIPSFYRLHSLSSHGHMHISPNLVMQGYYFKEMNSLNRGRIFMILIHKRPCRLFPGGGTISASDHMKRHWD